MKYTLRHKVTGFIPEGCKDVADRDLLASWFMNYLLLLNKQDSVFCENYEHWARGATTNEILSEAFSVYGFVVFTDEDNEEDYSDYPKSEWKEDAEQFRKLAIKLGILADSVDDTDPADYEEQQFGDWANATVEALAKQNLEIWKLNF